jgi:hypothetical protein
MALALIVQRCRDFQASRRKVPEPLLDVVFRVALGELRPKRGRGNPGAAGQLREREIRRTYVSLCAYWKRQGMSTEEAAQRVADWPAAPGRLKAERIADLYKEAERARGVKGSKSE